MPQGQQLDMLNPVHPGILGVVETITFRNPDNGFSILKVRHGEGRKQDLTTVTGTTTAKVGEQVDATGSWVQHPTFGRQLKASEIKVSLPEDAHGIRNMLASGWLPGIGEVLADRLVAAFGADTLKVLESQPDRWLTVKGMSKAKLAQSVAVYQDEHMVLDIIAFLKGYDIPNGQARKIYARYGKESMRVLQDTPYRLAEDIEGIGFLSADKIALAMGTGHDSPERAKAGIVHCLKDALRDGNCGMARKELIALTVKMLESPESVVTDSLQDNLDRSRPALVEYDGVVYPADLARAEELIARRLLALASQTPSFKVRDIESLIARAEADFGQPFADAQREAIRLSLTRRVLVITGGPGVGKTATQNTILNLLVACGADVALAAPTGKAAKRMAELTGRPALTVHRLLGIGRDGVATQDLQCTALVLDEMSMADVPLMAKVMQALPATASLILVGDVDQLPSVGPGQILRDMLDSGAVPSIRLTQVFRQAEGSAIIRNAHRVNQGKMPEDGNWDEDFIFIGTDSATETAEVIERLVRTTLPRMGINARTDVQVLAPMHRGEVGTQALNNLLQSVLNPQAEGEVSPAGRSKFYVGDRVLQTINDYDKDVFNGDAGMITDIDSRGDMRVTFDGRVVTYKRTETDMLLLAYAMSIHKSQGSQFPVVIVPVVNEHYMMLARNLLYTAMTRAVNRVILVGQTRALAITVKNNKVTQRVSRLKTLLQQGAV